MSHSAKNERSISLYTETNYSLCITECYYLSLYLHPYLNTLTRLSAPYLNTCIAYLNTLSRLSAPYLNTCIACSWVGFRLHIFPHSSWQHPRQPIRIEHPSRQPEHPSRHYVTRELSAPGRPFSALGSSRLAIAYLNTWGSSDPPPPPPDQLTLLLLWTYAKSIQKVFLLNLSNAFTHLKLRVPRVNFLYEIFQCKGFITFDTGRLLVSTTLRTYP